MTRSTGVPQGAPPSNPQDDPATLEFMTRLRHHLEHHHPAIAVIHAHQDVTNGTPAEHARRARRHITGRPISAATYRNHGCRCRRCREAHRLYQAKKRHRRKDAA